MICQRCNKKEATGYMETTINGIKKRVYVCPECFKQAQLEMYSSYDDMGLFSGLMGVPGAKAKCSKCGTTLREISDTCFVGCQYCYSEFGDRLKPLLRNLQSAQMHIGSGPDGEKSDEIAELNGRLRKAVEAEDYEQALKIQEMLKKLKGEEK